MGVLKLIFPELGQQGELATVTVDGDIKSIQVALANTTMIKPSSVFVVCALHQQLIKLTFSWE